MVRSRHRIECKSVTRNRAALPGISGAEGELLGAGPPSEGPTRVSGAERGTLGGGHRIGSPRLMLSNYLKLSYCSERIDATLPRSLPTFVWDSLKRANFAAPSWSMTESTME